MEITEDQRLKLEKKFQQNQKSGALAHTKANSRNQGLVNLRTPGVVARPKDIIRRERIKNSKNPIISGT